MFLNFQLPTYVTSKYVLRQRAKIYYLMAQDGFKVKGNSTSNQR